MPRQQNVFNGHAAVNFYTFFSHHRHLGNTYENTKLEIAQKWCSNLQL